MDGCCSLDIGHQGGTPRWTQEWLDRDLEEFHHDFNNFHPTTNLSLESVYNEVVSLLAHTDDQDKGKIALRIAFIAEPKLAIVLRVLLEKLQKDEQSRVDIYCALEKVLQQDTQGLERRLLEKIITLASNHMRETQEATNELKVAASNTLVTLARCYFNDVMCELLYRLELPEEFIFITLGNLSSAYALQCIPFVGMILNVMISMLELVKDSRMRQAFCGGFWKKCSRAVNGYFTNWGKCPFPRMGESQFCNRILPLYCHVTSNWLTCEELELKQDIIKALGPMMSLLLHRKEPQNPIFKEISWLLEQYKEEMDILHVTKVVASSPYEREGHGCAALQLLKALHQTIHAAVGVMWGVKIPSLLQYIEGNTENSLDHARWEHMLLQFLRTSLEKIDDSAWSSQISLELSWQMAGYASPSKEKSFLYKALGTSLAACQDLVHVKSQIHTLLMTADYMEAPERQGVVSILAVCAASHLDLTLKALQEFGAAMSKVKISGFVSRLKRLQPWDKRQDSPHPDADIQQHGCPCSKRAASLLSRGRHHKERPSPLQNQLSGVLGITVTNKDMHLKLTLIQAVTEISCAIWETRDSQELEFSYKPELRGCVLDFIKREPLDSLAPPVFYKAILAIRHLSKLKPSLTSEANHELLHQCLKSLFSLPPLEKMMKEEGETAKDALPIQSLYVESLEALGKLMKTVLEEEPTTHWFQEMFQLLETWLSSEKEWERERALQATIQLLTTYQETVHSTTQGTFDRFGSLIGLIAPYSCDSLATSRQWVVDCISCLLCIQEPVHKPGSAEEELRCLREALTAPDPEALFQASSKMARVVSEYFPSEQAKDFIEATLGGLLSASPTCAKAAGLWMKIILKECGDAMLDKVPDILGYTISPHACYPGGQLEAVPGGGSIHSSSPSPRGSDLQPPQQTSADGQGTPLSCGDLWGGDPLLATQVLRALIDKIKTPTRTEGSITSETEIDRHLAAAEPLLATCAILEVVSALQSIKAVRELLPELFPVLLQ
ncbi:unnamed protein product [Lepidochelys kempii]